MIHSSLLKALYIFFRFSVPLFLDINCSDFKALLSSLAQFKNNVLGLYWSTKKLCTGVQLLYKFKWLLNISIFIKKHSKRDIQIQITLRISRACYARAFWGVILAFININIDFGISKIGNPTSKHTKVNVCKNDCTCARNILSFYLLNVN